MEKDEIINGLCKLVQLDIDAVEAYTQAIEKIDPEPIRNSLIKFRSDHQQHITNLSAKIKELGDNPPQNADLKGLLLEGVTKLRSITGTEGALSAMRMNEKITNKTYAEALEQDWPADIMALIQNNANDEQGHLSYIEQALETKAWDASGVPHA
jgi:uncharacterized protein (TIGR02284 family)